VEGKVILYADNITGSMQRAMEETSRRRAVQTEYNEKHGFEPKNVLKEVRETIRSYDAVAEVVSQYNSETASEGPIRLEDIPIVIASLEKEMKDFAKIMEFEKAAGVRDEINRLRQVMGTTDGKLGISSRRKLRRPKPAGRSG
jgi:excinuclease ABC subunit B